MKTLAMYRPNAIQSALNDFDRYFESFFGDSVMNTPARIFNQLPAVDVRETEKAYIMDMELPGYDEKDIEIHVDGSSLSIASKQEVAASADGNAGADKKEGAWILRERKINSFTRSFKLPENSNPEEVSAEFKNGILTMEIKKRPEAQKRAIQIKVK